MKNNTFRVKVEIKTLITHAHSFFLKVAFFQMHETSYSLSYIIIFKKTKTFLPSYCLVVLVNTCAIKVTWKSLIFIFYRRTPHQLKTKQRCSWSEPIRTQRKCIKSSFFFALPIWCHQQTNVIVAFRELGIRIKANWPGLVHCSLKLSHWWQMENDDCWSKENENKHHHKGSIHNGGCNPAFGGPLFKLCMILHG